MFLTPLNAVRFKMSRGVKVTGRVASATEMRNVHKILFRKPKDKRR
jgi:hypothetical protein